MQWQRRSSRRSYAVGAVSPPGVTYQNLLHKALWVVKVFWALMQV